MSEIQKCPNLVRGGGQHFSKMSEIQKCPNLVRRGGGSIFQKCLKFKNVPKVGGGLIGTLSQIFSIFYLNASP